MRGQLRVTQSALTKAFERKACVVTWLIQKDEGPEAETLSRLLIVAEGPS